MQRLTIKKQAKKSIKTNDFEQSFLNGSRYKNKSSLGWKDDQKMGKNGGFKQNNFEITNKTI